MINFSQWVPHVPGIALAACAALCLIFAVLLVIVGVRRPTVGNAGEAAHQEATKENQRLKLHCGDLKVLANLAIQRHMDDAAFLHHLRGQPCYDALLAHLDVSLQRQLTKDPADHFSKSTLAVACLKDTERLEHKLFAPTAIAPQFKHDRP